jgi:hypothetical protein
MKDVRRSDRKRGAARMFQLGKKSVQFFLNDAQVAMVRAAFPHCSLAAVARDTLLNKCRDRGQHEYMHIKKEG